VILPVGVDGVEIILGLRVMLCLRRVYLAACRARVREGEVTKDGSRITS
jgi:hypothetical protein